MHLDYTDADLVDLGRQALSVEIDGLRAQLPRLGADFARACRICLGCRGRIVVTGMGKSGHIAGKIAATLASTAATPAGTTHLTFTAANGVTPNSTQTFTLTVS